MGVGWKLHHQCSPAAPAAVYGVETFCIKGGGGGGVTVRNVKNLYLKSIFFGYNQGDNC